MFSLFWKRLSAKGAFWGLALSLIFGLPLSIYANVTENVHLIVLAAIMSVAIGFVVCLLAGFTNKKTEYDFAQGKTVQING